MKFFFLVAIFLFISIEHGLAFTMVIPSMGTCVREADVIVKGTFAVDNGTVVFYVTSTIKGAYTPQQRIPVTKYKEDIFFNLNRFVSEFQTKECVVLGTKQDDGILLCWSPFSVWPHGLTGYGPMFETVESCMDFITAILAYEKLEQRDPQMCAKNLIRDIKDDKRRPFAFAYLDSYQDTTTWRRALGVDEDLRDDVLRVVAMHIVTRHLDDKWTFDHVRSLSSSMPKSIMLPYFMKIASSEGSQKEAARSRLPPMVNLPLKETEYETTEARALEMIPMFQQLDAKKSIHLFDSPNEELANSASLLFSTIFNEPAPKGMTRAKEKAFWQTKIIKEKARWE